MKKIHRNATKRQELKDKTYTHTSMFLFYLQCFSEKQLQNSSVALHKAKNDMYSSWFIDLESETSPQDTSLFDLNPFSWKIYVTGNNSSPVHKDFLAWLLKENF